MGTTNLGLAAIAGRVGGVGSISAFDYIAVGSSDTAFVATQTALVSEITDGGLARAQVTPTRVTTNQTNDTLQLSKQWSVTATRTVKEAAILNASSGGIMLVRKVLSSAQTLENNDTFTYTLQHIYT